MTNLLLLLSAMLSALVGVGPGGRVAQAPVTVASVTAEQAAPVIVRRVAARPLMPPVGIVAVLCLGVIAVIPARGIVPAWKSRRRE